MDNKFIAVGGDAGSGNAWCDVLILALLCTLQILCRKQTFRIAPLNRCHRSFSPRAWFTLTMFLACSHVCALLMMMVQVLQLCQGQTCLA